MAAKEKEVIKINIADWIDILEAILREEEGSFETERDVIDTLINKHGLSSGEAGQVIIAAKQCGLLPEDMNWPEHKTTLSLGGASKMHLILSATMIKRELDNGKKVEVREYIGYVKEREEEDSHAGDETHVIDATQSDNGQSSDDSPPYVATSSEDGIQRSKDYLTKVVPGHIYNRLKELAAAKEDLKPVVKELKGTIDGMVKELS